jgi:hypothetical protein
VINISKRSLSFILLSSAAFCLVAACAGRGGGPRGFLERFGLEPGPSARRFSVCTSFACESSVAVSLTDEEKRRLVEIFEPAPESAAEERRRIASAVGLMERMIGPRAGTANDAPRNLWVEGRPRGQLDCMAETANTSTYLLIMQSEKLIRFHRPAETETRGTILFDYHNTAAVEETATGRMFAVDSWFGENGDPAHVVPLADWEDGWEPRED